MDSSDQAIFGAKRIIRDYIDVKDRSLRDIATLAGVNVSQLSKFLNPKNRQKSIDAGTAIKLYAVLYEELSSTERHTFLQAFGLLEFAAALQNGPELTWGVNTFKRVAVDSHALGVALTHWGNTFIYGANRWEAAIPIFRDAEATFARFGAASTDAARVACMVAVLHLNLTDYVSALQELERIERTYSHVMDPGTQALFYGIQGWLHYYLGNYSQSEAAFFQHMRLANTTGLKSFADSIRHLLGRLYCDWAQATRDRSLRDQYFTKAATQLNRAQLVSKKLGDERSMAYNLLRQAQLLRAQGRSMEARNVCKTIRDDRLFSNDTSVDLSILHLKLEEVRLDLATGENTVTARNRAEEVLRQWREVKYAKGMADAVHILAASKGAEGRIEEALVLYVAALVLYPFEGHLRNQQVWETISVIREDIKDQKGTDTYGKLFQGIQEQIESRQGYFSYLNQVAADRSNDINRILLRLDNLRDI